MVLLEKFTYVENISPEEAVRDVLKSYRPVNTGGQDGWFSYITNPSTSTFHVVSTTLYKIT